MKDRILNISIIVLVIACLFLGGRLLYKNYMDECEAYNNNIVNFAVEMIKGNKSLEDIDSLDATDSVKDSLRTYYNDNFYSDDDLILIYEDVAYFESIKDEIEKEQRAYGDAFFDPDCDYFWNLSVDESGEEVDEETEKYNYVAVNYLYYNKDKNSSEIIKKDNNLYIKSSDLKFNGEDFVDLYYNGLNVFVIAPEDGKISRENRRDYAYYKNLVFIREYDEDKNTVYLYSSDAGYAKVNISLVCKMNIGKIKNMDIITNIIK